MNTYTGILPAEILLPRADVDPARWAVVACDQYTSQPDYWQAVENFVADAPSTLKITFPEIYLSEGSARIGRIQAEMKKYLDEGVLEPAVKNGFILLERTTPSGVRPGLVVRLDLEQYDFTPGANALVRATEGTILSRIPPRVKIREGAPLESPHVMVLLDDPDCTVIEPIQAMQANLRKLYDFDLMQNGGHLAGWAVEGEALAAAQKAIENLLLASNGFLAAVGDGNHSLATARQCWMNVRDSIPEAERANHPARYALVELNNLHAPALMFEPIHRVLFGVDPLDVQYAFAEWCACQGAGVTDGGDITWIAGTNEIGISVENAPNPLPVATLQAFLDLYLADHPEAEIDYIHGADVVRELAAKPDTLGLLLNSIDKASLFPAIRKGGVLPRKTFSMGEAFEKRYYMECRRIL